MESHSALGDGEMYEIGRKVLKTTDPVILKIREWLRMDNVHLEIGNRNRKDLVNNSYCSRNLVGIFSVTSTMDLQNAKKETYSLALFHTFIMLDASSEKGTSSMRKMCGFKTSCTCAKSHPGICSLL